MQIRDAAKYLARCGITSLIASPRRLGEVTARQIKWPTQINARQPVVLCLNRTGLRSDIEQLKALSRINFAEISAATLKFPQERWVPRHLREQTYFFDTLQRSPSIKSWTTDFALAFLRAASKSHRLDAVLAGNFDYWQDQSIAIACRELRIPFVVLSRENNATESSAAWLLDRIVDAKYRFQGHGVAVSSEYTNNTLCKSGAFGAAKITTTGWPRYDVWLTRCLAPLENRKAITLFSFAADLYMGAQTFVDVATVFAESARRHADSDVRFILKVKKRNEIQVQYSACPALIDSPVQVVSEEGATDLLASSRLIISYNSSVLLEGLLANVPIAVPWWGDAKENPYIPLVHPRFGDDSKFFLFPESSRELAVLLSASVKGALSPMANREACYWRFSRQNLVDQSEPASTRVGRFVTEIVDGIR